jgi:hypothetical protein
MEIETIHLSEVQTSHLGDITAAFPDDLASGREADAVNWVEEQVHQWPDSARQSFDPIVSRVDTNGVVVIKGLELPTLPATPDRYLPVNKADVSHIDVPQLCVSALIGAAYGTGHVRGGRVIADVIPRAGFEKKPDSAFGSHEMFDFHVDGVVQPDTMPDKFALHCLRNKLRTPTLVSNIEGGNLSDKEFELLQHDVFTLRYSGPNDTIGMRTNTPIIDATSGNGLRYNYYGEAKATCEHPDVDTAMYIQALKSFHDALNKNAVPLVLEPGDIAIIDNARTPHARASFDASATPAAEGRWLRRIHIATQPETVEKILNSPDRILHSVYI